MQCLNARSTAFIHFMLPLSGGLGGGKFTIKCEVYIYSVYEICTCIVPMHVQPIFVAMPADRHRVITVRIQRCEYRYVSIHYYLKKYYTQTIKIYYLVILTKHVKKNGNLNGRTAAGDTRNISHYILGSDCFSGA